MKRQYHTTCVHLYMHPKENKENQNFQSNLYIDGQVADLKALLITAARLDEGFHQAFLEGAEWLRRDEGL